MDRSDEASRIFEDELTATGKNAELVLADEWADEGETVVKVVVFPEQEKRGGR
ncbi:MAG: hypothetical protein KatS3mg061_0036 [Dehalococcoidia bacterium]|nr:MAG: hypothetical protein KatS3mg061_0036 [Dehalococcoidia bacterium]